MIKTIKILGTGCSKCKKTHQVVEKIVSNLKLEINVIMIKDIEEIMSYSVMSTPAVVVDEVVKISGRIPSSDEIMQLVSCCKK